MIPLKDAQAEGFVNSTRQELRKYAEDLGIDTVPPNANADALKKIVRAALGMPTENQNGPAPAQFKPEVKAAKGGDKIFPSYNLSPNGIWGGRRHRLSIPRPEGVKLGQAEGYGWNGKHTFYLPYDEVVAVPEPIYQILITNKRRRPIQKQVPLPTGGTEVTTDWEFDSTAMHYIGVDSVTADRAGSLMEWYQSRGSKFFDELTLRQMQLIATRLEIKQAHVRGPGIPPIMFTEDELRGALKEFFYGYADAEVEANDKIAA